MCEGRRCAFASQAARDGSGQHQHGFPRSRAAGTELRPASAANAAKARGFFCPETTYIGPISMTVVFKSDGVLRVGPLGYFKTRSQPPHILP